MLVHVIITRTAKKIYFVPYYANYLRFSFFDPSLLQKKGFLHLINEEGRKILFYIPNVHSPVVGHSKRRFRKWSASPPFLHLNCPPNCFFWQFIVLNSCHESKTFFVRVPSRKYRSETVFHAHSNAANRLSIPAMVIPLPPPEYQGKCHLE